MLSSVRLPGATIVLACASLWACSAGSPTPAAPDLAPRAAAGPVAPAPLYTFKWEVTLTPCVRRYVGIGDPKVPQLRCQGAEVKGSIKAVDSDGNLVAVPAEMMPPKAVLKTKMWWAGGLAVGGSPPAPPQSAPVLEGPPPPAKADVAMPQVNPSIATVVWAGKKPDGSDAKDPGTWEYICLEGELYAFANLKQRKLECFKMVLKKN